MNPNYVVLQRCVNYLKIPPLFNVLQGSQKKTRQQLQDAAVGI